MFSCFYTPFLFFSLFFFSDYLFSVHYNNRRGGVGRDGMGPTRVATATWNNMGVGWREEELGGVRKTGWYGTWGQLRQGQVAKEDERELRRADRSGRRGKQAGRQARAEAGQHYCYPASALVI